MREYADQSRAAVVAAGYQRLGRQHQQQQQLARSPERDGRRRRQHQPSSDLEGGWAENHLFDGNDSDEGFYRSESPPRKPLNPRNQLGRYT